MKISSTEDVRKIVGDKNAKVVYYHMEGCPYCVKTTPLWNKVKKMSFPYKFYEVESAVVPSEFGIQGFPQFHIRDKDGVRTVEGSKDTVAELVNALALKKSGGTRKHRRRGNRTRRFVGRVR